MRNTKGQFKKGHHWRNPQPFWDKEWLVENYVEKKRSSGEIAKEFGVTDAAVLFWLKKHHIKRRTVSEARAEKHWGSRGKDNAMWGRFGAANPRWLGGVTPERQDFYASRQWKKARTLVWKRDNATCQRCGMHQSESERGFHIHHIASFAVKPLRAKVDNLILLCPSCHHFIHSKKNEKREYLQEI